MVVRLTYGSGGYTANALYNPLNKTVAVATNGIGNVTLTHNLNTTKLTFTGSGNTSSRAYINFYDVTVNSVRIMIGNDNSPDSYGVDVLIYDYGTY